MAAVGCRGPPRSAVVGSQWRRVPPTAASDRRQPQPKATGRLRVRQLPPSTSRVACGQRPAVTAAAPVRSRRRRPATAIIAAAVRGGGGGGGGGQPLPAAAAVGCRGPPPSAEVGGRWRRPEAFGGGRRRSAAAVGDRRRVTGSCLLPCLASGYWALAVTGQRPDWPCSCPSS